jgi:hypothetical protein
MSQGEFVTGNLPCAIDKLNSHRKYGETSTASQSSKDGIFRTGISYEWAGSNRYQIPSDSITHYDQPIPKFHENYSFNSYNRLSNSNGMPTTNFRSHQASSTPTTTCRSSSTPTTVA